MPASGRGEPWPYDCIMGGMPMMLTNGPKKESPWSEEKVKYFQPESVMTAEDRNYQQFPPEIDLPQAQEDWAGGYGLSHQNRKEKDRYSHALFADCSSGHPMNGPQVNSQQVVTGEPREWVTFTISGVETVIMSTSTGHLYKRTNDTGTGWSLISATGSAIGKMAVFRGTQSVDYLFIPQSTGPYKILDSTGTISTHASQTAYQFVVAGDELYLITYTGNQWILKKTFNGGATPTWIGNYPIGDSSSTPTDVQIVATRLLVGKTNGVYGVSALVSPLAEDVTPSLHKTQGSANNCRGGAVFAENYVFPYNDSLFRYDPASGQLEQFGPETILDNKSEVRGKVQAVASQDGMAIYAFMYNTATAKSYMAKFGTWENGIFVKKWHASLYQWNKSIVAAGVVQLDWGGGQGRLPRMYVGASDGTVYWFTLPRTANPQDDPNYRFNPTDVGEVYQARYTANFPFEYKVLKSVGIVGHNQTGTRPLGASYKLPSDVSWQPMGQVTSEPGDKLSIQSTPSDKAFDFKITLSNSDNTGSAVVEAFVVYSAIRFENLKEIVAYVNVSDEIITRDGRLTRQRWQDIRERIETLCNTAGSVTVISPTGETLTCLAIEFGHAVLVEDTENSEFIWKSRIKLIQTKTEATRGTWNRAGAYTWDAISVFRWSELAVI